MEEVFDVVAAGDEVAAKKPAPDVYLLALDRLGLGADQALAFEDSTNGVRSAKAAGLSVVVTPSAYTEKDDFRDADFMVESLDSKDFPADAASLASGPSVRTWEPAETDTHA